MTDYDVVKGAIIALGVAFDVASDQLKVAAATVRGCVFEEQLGRGSSFDTDGALSEMREAKAKVDRLRLAIQVLEDVIPDVLGHQSVAVEEYIASLTAANEGDDLTQEELERALSGDLGFLDVDENGYPNKVPAVW
jgi:hypothetical protein